MDRAVIVVAGPTASGKSALALDLAREFGGVVVNADAMQVYDGLRVLTARPTPEDEAAAPHRLYGVLPPSEACSAGRWREMAALALEDAWAAGSLPVVVGGTGLYIRALTRGLSPIPEVPAEIRDGARALFASLGNDAFHRLLSERDPLTAGRLHPGNSQRLVRAFEVFEATGRPLAEWQAAPPTGGVAARILTLVLEPPREALYAACDGRFLAMLERGALDEARHLAALGLDPALPAMKALGVPELLRVARGEVGVEEAAAAAQRATRNFAKRQLTWFRHQLDDPVRIPAQYSESLGPKIFSIIREFLLTGQA
ncbi:MAG: tRNA (adenosine(37)-N6)-dimethylallyltransferase MiaA [Alphaproteobacteria bacterium]|nr:tRNA (adenosine(37)-N6)-dimethylallyltransferase MiaA [Alphaproteobacteria bacterium]